MKKKLGIIFLLLIAAFALGACNGGSDGFSQNREINVISRETGSGTRDAFIELVGVQERTADGTVDRTSSEAYIAPGTSIVLSRVETNLYAIGYISLGSLNDSVRAVPINGVMPTVAAVQNGTYPIFRAFNLAVPAEVSDLTQDFIDFVLSAEGQAVVEGRRYVPVTANAPAYNGSHGMTGTVVVLGSTSVAPVMEHLKEAYEAINPGVTIEVQSAGSSAGINSARDGLADIGMSSRELTDAELEILRSIPMAFDGVAVIVHNDNPVPALTIEQVRQIFVGDTTRWSPLIP